MSTFSMKAVAVATVIGGAIAGAVTASAALNLPTQNCTYTFNTNMKLGSRGTDVMNLQKVLNAYPQTRIAASGAGSPGMESSYFGKATRAAVMKFQALQLVELGITKPTGNVFAGTRGLLNQICTATGSTTTTTATGTTTIVGVPSAVTVVLAPTQPTGMIAQSQAAARLADLSFTGTGTVTNVTLQRIGVSDDSTLNNVYLYDGATRISDSAAVATGGKITFNNPNGIFTVAGSRTVTVRADTSSTSQGKSVGVQLVSVTTTGASPVTFTNVMGNSLLVANVSPATANFNSVDTTARTVDAGTTNFTLWSGPLSIGTRDAILKGATFKFIGSAPIDAAANLGLYLDGVKIDNPAINEAISAANNNRLTFDLSGPLAQRVKTGSHTLEVRGDIVKGSSFTYQLSVETQADLMLEDSQLSGVNIATTVGGSAAISTSNSAYGVITINKGSVTVNTDPSFVANRVVGGATNVPIAQFLFKAYGEDVKVNTLIVTPTLSSITPSSTGLNNVSLYVNGGQVGTTQNYSGTGTLTYNLGSSLVIPANTTVTVTVNADIQGSANVAYTGGSVSATVSGSANNGQGMRSNQLVNVANSGVTGQVLTVTTGAGSFGRTAGFVATTVAPNTTGVKLGSFTLQAGSAESVNVTSATLTTTPSSGMTVQNISNLTIKNGSTVIGTPVGNVATTTTFSFNNINVPINTTQTFDVYGDLGNATGSVQVDMSLTYRGTVSNVTTTSSATGIAISPVLATLATSTLVSSAPVSQYLVGNSSFGIGSFNLYTTTGNATVREMDFTVSATDTVQSVTVNGITANVVAGTAKIFGLSIPLSATQTQVPVTVKYAGFKNSTSGGNLTSGTTTTISLSYVEALTGTQVVSSSAVVGSNPMYLYASKPTLTGMTGNGTLTVGNALLGSFTVAADANGAISVGTTSIITTISSAGTTTVTNVKLSDDNGATAIANSNVVTSVTSGTAYAIGFTTPYLIPAGTSKTFSIWGTVSNTGGFGTSGSSQVSTALDTTLGNFKWNDVVTGGALTGTGIQNFPVTSYSLKN